MNKKLRYRRRRIGTFFTVVITLVVLAVLFVLAVNAWMYFSTKNDIYAVDALPDGDYDCILILGAGVHSDGSPSNMLEDRLKTGISLYNNGKAPVILMSGDHGTADYDEVNNMKKYATDAGVDADAIFLDHAGFSTYDSLYRAKEVFGADKIVIVTQKYHLYRALYIADSLGIEAVGVPADLREYRGQPVYDAREILARTKDFFTAILKPLPICLGDKIDLTGSASQTDG